MSFSVARRLASALSRVYTAIDLRADEQQLQLASDHIDNVNWIRARAAFYGRSIGQRNRYRRAKK